MKTHTKTKTGLIIGIILIYSTINYTIIIFNSENADKYSNQSNSFISEHKHLKLSNNVSNPIHIVGNSGWVDFKNVGKCTGNGTLNNPYIIENLRIDGRNSGFCVLIENSNVYFKIYNCFFYGARFWEDWDHHFDFENNHLNIAQIGWNYSAIVLSFVNNAQLINNTCHNNDRGIFLLNSDNNNISRNKISDLEDPGIEFYNSSNNLISENMLTENWGGSVMLYLHSSHSNIITRNTFINQYAMCWLEIECEGNIFIHNYCSPYHLVLGIINGITLFLFSFTFIVTVLMLMIKKIR
jgi:parallel beta-helix repeat protein